MLLTFSQPHADLFASPMAMLEARRQIVCPTCTVDKSRPVMIIEGEPWEVHCRTKVHRKLSKKASREKDHVESKVVGD